MMRYVLLALLAEGEPKHGYALMKAYAERAGVRLSIGNVYRELQNMVRLGWITTAPNPVGADARRAPYAILPLGRSALARWLAEPGRLVSLALPDQLSHRLALIGDIDPEQADAFLLEVHDTLWREAKELERVRALSEERPPIGTDRFPTRPSLLSRQAKHLAADIELVAEMRAELGSWRKRFGTKETAEPSEPVRKPLGILKHRLRG